MYGNIIEFVFRRCERDLNRQVEPKAIFLGKEKKDQGLEMSPQVELYLLVVSVCSSLHNTFHSVPLLDFCGHLLCIAHVFRAGVMQQIIRSVNRRSCLAI